MIRAANLDTLAIATVAASVVLRLEPQNAEMLVISARQVVRRLSYAMEHALTIARDPIGLRPCS